MSLAISVKSEMRKTRRTAAFYFTLIGAAVIPFMFLFSTVGHGLPNENASNKDPLNAIFQLSFNITGLSILPLFIVLVCTLLPQIEYKNNAWKQVLTSPQTRANIFLAKFLNVHLLILLFIVASHLYMWIVAVVAHFSLPALNVLSHPLDLYPLLVNYFNTYVTVLAMATLQFWIGIRVRNFIIPIAIGVALWLIGTLLSLEYHSPLAKYFPYSFHTFNASAEHRVLLNQVGFTSFACSIVFLFFGYLDFKRKRPG